MEPRLIFLGTGGDSIVVGKGLRSAGGIILQVEDNQLHIDPGPGALARARDFGVNVRNNVAVLVSHSHMNHVNDVNAVINAMTLGGLDKKGVLVSNRTAVEGALDMDAYVTKHHLALVERSIVLEPGQRVGINEVEIRATRAQHTEPNTVGFKFMTPKFSMGYTSDTGYMPELVTDFKGVDLLVLNVVYPADKKDRHQLNTEDAIRLLNEIKPKLAIVTHFGIKMEEADVLNEVRKIQKETKVQAIAAKDGLAINPISYAVSLRQKTLNLYQ